MELLFGNIEKELNRDLDFGGFLTHLGKFLTENTYEVFLFEIIAISAEYLNHGSKGTSIRFCRIRIPHCKDIYLSNICRISVLVVEYL